MRIDAGRCTVGSAGLVPQPRHRSARSIAVTLSTGPTWKGGHIGPASTFDFTCSAYDARMLARALVAEARVVEAARR